MDVQVSIHVALQKGYDCNICLHTVSVVVVLLVARDGGRLSEKGPAKGVRSIAPHRQQIVSYTPTSFPVS